MVSAPPPNLGGPRASAAARSKSPQPGSGRSSSPPKEGTPADPPPCQDMRRRSSHSHSERVNIKPLPASDSEAERRRNSPPRSHRDKDREIRRERQHIESPCRERSRRRREVFRKRGLKKGPSEGVPSREWKPTLCLDPSGSEPAEPPKVSLHGVDPPDGGDSVPEPSSPTTKGGLKGKAKTDHLTGSGPPEGGHVKVCPP